MSRNRRTILPQPAPRNNPMVETSVFFKDLRLHNLLKSSKSLKFDQNPLKIYCIYRKSPIFRRLRSKFTYYPTVITYLKKHWFTIVYFGANPEQDWIIKSVEFKIEIFHRIRIFKDHFLLWLNCTPSLAGPAACKNALGGCGAVGKMDGFWLGRIPH